MTRLQLIGVGLLSVLATIAVLAGGVGASGADPELRAALTRQVTVQASAASATTEATPATAEEPSDEPASDDAVVETADASAVATDDAETTGDDASSDAADVDIDPADFDDTPDAESGSDTASGDSTTAASDAPKPTRIKHVFVITLAGRGFDATFGPQSAAPYLAQELRAKGTLLSGYSSLGRADLPDLLALVSGQAPNAATRANCTTYQEIPPSTKVSKSGEVSADGCVYPNTLITLADQVTASGQPWRAYIEDMEKGPRGDIKCRHPLSNGVDDTQQGRPGDGYAARHNPFVYFHSLLDLSDCDAKDGPLTALEADLASAKKTAALSYIAPNLCNDGTESPCADGSPGGLPAADAFLKTWVPKILASPAYKKDGLLIVTFAGALGAAADAPAKNGTLLISQFAKPGGTDNEPHSPYTLLRSIEDALGLKPLAKAKTAPSLINSVLATSRIVVPGDD